MSICTSCGADNPAANRFCGSCGAALPEPEPSRESRKTVTVLFCDVTGSTALGERLDPEALRALLARYFERMKAIVERHGGTVEKFIGDAVMAVFGVPTLHEDDALRAVRAAVEMRDALPGARRSRGTDRDHDGRGGDRDRGAPRDGRRGQRGRAPRAGGRARRDPGRRARRAALARDAVEVEELEPLELKGKAEPVRRLPPARRHGAARRARASARRADGRPRARAAAALRRVGTAPSSERTCLLFTLLGTAGRRQVAAGRRVPRGRVDATVRRGPLPLLRRGDHLLARRRDRQAAALGRASSASSRQSSRAREPARRRGRGDDARARSPGRSASCSRPRASSRPLVVVFDDIHWGEPAFLDLIEHVADLSRGAPILLLCLARPELLERAPVWGGGEAERDDRAARAARPRTRPRS